MRFPSVSIEGQKPFGYSIECLSGTWRRVKPEGQAGVARGTVAAGGRGDLLGMVLHCCAGTLQYSGASHGSAESVKLQMVVAASSGVSWRVVKPAPTSVCALHEVMTVQEAFWLGTKPCISFQPWVQSVERARVDTRHK